MKRSLSQLKTSASIRFSGQAPRVWVVWLGENLFKALIINTENKNVLCRGPIKKTYDDALNSCKLKLNTLVINGKNLNLDNHDEKCYPESADVIIELYTTYTLGDFVSPRARRWVAENVIKEANWSKDNKLIIPTESIPHFMYAMTQFDFEVYEGN